MELPEPAQLPAIDGLPDALTSFDGSNVQTAADWTKRRRPELRRLFEHYMYAELPPTPRSVAARVLYENRSAFGGKALLREVALDVGSPADGPIHVLLAFPNERKGPAPAFVGIAFGGNHAAVDDPNVRQPVDPPRAPDDRGPEPPARGQHIGVWKIETILDRGCAIALFRTADVAPDRRDWPTAAGPSPYSSLGLWAWGASRVLDYLASEPAVDETRTAVVGHSRNGKAALVAAAFDDRFAMAIPAQSGCGGAAPSRTDSGEKLENINGAFPHWFNDRFKQFNPMPERLPFDQHCLIAMVAPRPVLLANAVEDTWCNPPGQFEMLRGADPVYRLVAGDGLLTASMPPLGSLSAGRLGYFIRPGKHSMTSEDWGAFLDYADRWL